MKSLNVIIVMLIAGGSAAFADSVTDGFKTITTASCEKTIAEKGSLKEFKPLKLKGSKLEAICLLVAMQSISTCAADTTKMAKVYLSSKEKEKVTKMMRSAMKFCSEYADLIATDMVNTVINKAITEKISIDEASVKIAEEAVKKE